MRSPFPSAQKITAGFTRSRVNRVACRAFCLALLIGAGLWAYDAAVIFEDQAKVYLGWFFAAALVLGAIKIWRAA